MPYPFLQGHDAARSLAVERRLPDDHPGALPTGRFFFIVGASGVGKDTLIAGLRERLAGDPGFLFARRCITRPAAAGGEDHEAMSDAAFMQAQSRGAFLLSWEAHGLRYGLPRALLESLRQGRHVIANGSRRAVGDLLARLPRDAVTVIEVTASPEVLRERLCRRGRESGEEIEERLRCVPSRYPAGTDVRFVSNDADPAGGAATLLDCVLSRLAPRGTRG